jgi:hypothetical protein
MIDMAAAPKKVKKRSHHELNKVYKECGVRSNKFFVYVKEFIIFVLNRYVKDYDEDLIIDCYMKIVDSIEGSAIRKKEWQAGYIDKETKEVVHGNYVTSVKEVPAYFNPERANIGNFIYTVIRNRATLYLYYKKKYFGELDSNEESLRNIITKQNTEVNTNLSMWFHYNTLKKLQISEGLKEHILENVINNEVHDNIFFKVAKWETVRSALS